MANPVSALTYDDFKYKQYFTEELDEKSFEDAKDSILAMWYGVTQLWEVLPNDVKLRKRSEVASLLVAWYLADLHPLWLTGGLSSSAGMGIQAKTIKDVTIKYKELNMPAEYDSLGSNQFGIKAANLIRYAPEMMGVYG